MRKIIQYKCDYCGDCFDSDKTCQTHEEMHKRVIRARQMLENGCTLSQINKECNIWRRIPENLKDVTKDHCFTISYWQCCDKPAYQIIDIDINGRLYLSGCGSWVGYYGAWVSIDSNNLRYVHDSGKLFVDPRYKQRLKEGW